MTEKITLTAKLAALVAKIESNPRMDNETMISLLEEVALTQNDIENFSFWDHPANVSYGRFEIYRSDRLKVFVLSWNPGDFTAIHDHEPAEWGAVQFFGQITHRLYSVDDKLITLVAADEIGPGTKVGVTGNLIHAMGNLSDNKALTLHIYGTNTQYTREETARIFDLETGRIVLTDGAAYLAQPSSGLKILPGRIEADAPTMEDYRSNTLIWRSRGGLS